MKKCIKCNIEKDKSEFYKNEGYSDGVLPRCKECHRKHSNKKSGYYREHYRRIETGEIEDDYSNHLLSHFGFYDENKIRTWVRVNDY